MFEVEEETCRVTDSRFSSQLVNYSGRDKGFA